MVLGLPGVYWTAPAARLRKEDAVSKISLVTLSVVAVATAILASWDGIRAQAVSTPFEYLQVTPFPVSVKTKSDHVTTQPGYRACVATSTEWSCRMFRPADMSNTALRTLFATLGDEGWELVSVVKEESATSGLTYFFKRQARVMP